MSTLGDFDRIDSVIHRVVAHERSTLNKSEQERREKEYSSLRSNFLKALAEEQGLEDLMNCGALRPGTELGEKSNFIFSTLNQLLLSRM